jgi:hypothetical protein
MHFMAKCRTLMRLPATLVPATLALVTTADYDLICGRTVCELASMSFRCVACDFFLHRWALR